MNWRVGVDAGGTFTDVCFFNEENGSIEITKVPSTPSDPSRAVVEGTQSMIEEHTGDGDISYFAHGSTVGTNALIQRRGVRTGLITTAGFRDLLELARQQRPHLYDLQTDKPEPLVSRDLRLEVSERILHDGTIKTEIDEDQVREQVRALKAAGVESIAISFLYSFAHPLHEQIVEEIVREEFPEAFVSSSHKVMPEFREYERLSTVVVNSYLGPVMEKYLRKLGPELQKAGVDAEPHINQSNGGVISFDTAAQLPARTVLSGPSSGVVGATYVAGLSGYDNLITFDMGGTSSDVSLILNGEPSVSSETEVEGYPIKSPMLDIRAVGAGGGSIAWIDSGGHLKVGPRSAGADPGPVCYGLGNLEPTVTDANVVLGTLNQTHLLDGRMEIDAEASGRAFDGIAERLGLDRMSTAQGVIRVVTANMARAIRVISVQRGYDPRDFTLVAFGGAGPLHASWLAQELDIPRVLIPETPGILCALGLLVSDLKTDYSVTHLLDAEPGSLQAMTNVMQELQKQADAWFDFEEIDEENRSTVASVDMRYRGQNYELSIPVPEGPITESTINALRVGFDAAHSQLYGYDASEEPVQMVTFRLEATGQVKKAELRAEELSSPDPAEAQVGTRSVYFPNAQGFVETPLYTRSELRAGNVIEGPAIVDQLDTTTVILPGQHAHVDQVRNLILETR